MTTLEGQRSTLSLLIFLLACSLSNAFQSYQPSGGSIGHKSQEIRLPRTFLFATPDDKDSRTATTTTSGVEEYKNVATKVLSNFMQKDKMDGADITNPIDDIDFDSGMKIPSSTSLEDLAQALDCELIEKEWFVTGKVNPIYFSDDFEFSDPDVQLTGIEDYARGVNKLFDQSTSRAAIISTVVNTTTVEPTVTCTWRLSGGVNIAFGLQIKPYIVYTDFTIDPQTSLIVAQEDRFDLPGWDILLSALFPFLIGKVTAPPTPPVPKREVTMPRSLLNGGIGGTGSSSNTNPLDNLMNLFNQNK